MDSDEARKIIEWHLLAAHVFDVRPLLYQAIVESGQPDDTDSQPDDTDRHG